MSLGIFSFDLAALIRRLENYIEAGAPEMAPLGAALENIETALENASATTLDETLVAAALSSSVTSVIAAAEKLTKEAPAQKTPPVRAGSARLDEAARKEIERLVKSLQTSVIHNYKSADIVDEAVSLNNIANFPDRNARERSGRKNEAAEQDRKREERKLEMLRAELKKAVLRHNSNV